MGLQYFSKPKDKIDNNTRDIAMDTNNQEQKRHGKTFIYALVAIFTVPILAYFGYDLLKQNISPCQSIFEQTKMSLNTKLKLLESEGELLIGPEKIQELTERAQLVALNLKTCCTVLDAGKVSPEEFLQCKASARDYESEVSKVITVTREIVKIINEGGVSKAQAQQRVATAVKKATDTSKSFNKRIVGIKKEHQLAALEMKVHESLEIDTQENEPNNEILSPNVAKLDTWISSSITVGNDIDYFTFETKPIHRDWVTIEVENRSTTLRPHIRIFDANKSSIFYTYNDTSGANVKHQYVTSPSTQYFVQITSRSKTRGQYLLRIHTHTAYDQFEPNESVLDAKPIQVNASIDAEIMDGKDKDYYYFKATQDGKIKMDIINRSTKLRPHYEIFNSNKASVKYSYNDTSGADISYTLKAKAGSRYYINISSRSSTNGGYTLKLSHK